MQRPSKRIKLPNGSLDNGGGFDSPIPYLHSDVVKYIFCWLPVKYATQAAVIAKAYRDSWRRSQILEFDSRSLFRHSFEEIISIINRVFAMHDGPSIKVVSLYLLTTSTSYEREIKGWVKKAISKGIEKLALNFVQATGMVKLSAEHIDIDYIRVLKLSTCEIDVPPRPRGLDFLHTVTLRKVRFTESMIQTLTERCTLLQNLELVSCKSFRRLKIVMDKKRRLRVLKLTYCSKVLKIEVHAPNLRTFHYHGAVNSFSFVDLTQLNDVIICFLPPRNYPRQHLFQNILRGLASVIVLTINSIILEGLFPNAEDGRLNKLECRFPNLKEVQLLINCGSHCNIYKIVSFLNNCPHAEKVYIDLNEAEDDMDWTVHREGELELLPSLESIRFVALDGFIFESNHQLELATFFLLKATSLEMLIVIPPTLRWHQHCSKRVNIPQYMRSFNHMESIWTKLNPKVDVKIYNSLTCFDPPVHLINTWY